jgi:hypothetical protein
VERRAARGSAVRGTSFRYSLSESATVTFTIERKTCGRRAGGKCRPKTKSNARKRGCDLWTRGGAFRAQATAGDNRTRFSGRIGKKALKAGSCRVLLAAIDASGNTSKIARTVFEILPARPPALG